MALIVQKFGGTSVGNTERIKHVADKVLEAKAVGHHVVVVVSAISGETDRLISLAKQFSDFPEPREYATLVATGEQVSMALLAIALNAKGHAARSYTAMQLGIHTQGGYRKASIVDINCERILNDISQGVISIVAGFQGVDEFGDITTLGRGGSDTTAVALAAALNADECQIYTDVEGVFTADPKIVPKARLLKEITFHEMIELAGLGAKVLQERAVEYAGLHKVPLRVLSTFKKGEGTLINYAVKAKKPSISGIAYNIDAAKLTLAGIPNHPGIASSILYPIHDAGIEVDMIIQNLGANHSSNFSFTVSRYDFERAYQLSQKTAHTLQAVDLMGDSRVAKLSIVGSDLSSHTNVTSTMFNTLSQENIIIEMMSTSDIKVSVVVAEERIQAGICALHHAFGLDGQPELPDLTSIY